MSATAAAVEAAAPVEEEAPAEETPVEIPAPEGEPVEAPAEGEKPPEVKPEITEEAIKTAAVRYANKTMAAARRAEARVEQVKTENASLRAENTSYKEFVTSFRTDPFGAIRQLGFGGIKEFVEHCRDIGEPRAASAEDQIAALRKEREEERKAAQEREAKQAYEAAQAKVFADLTADKGRWPFASTRRGQLEVWEAVTEYYQLHGSVPDAAVPLLADEVEKEWRAEFGDKVSVQRQDATKPGAPAAQAATAGSKSGTMTNKQTAGAPVRREYSMNPEERRRQVNEDMRKAGEIA